MVRIVAIIAVAAAALCCRPCLAVQSQDWPIVKNDPYEQIARQIVAVAGEDWQVKITYADKLRGWDGKALARTISFQHRTLKLAQPPDDPAAFSFTIAAIPEVISSTARLARKEGRDDACACMGADRQFFWFSSPGTYGEGWPREWQTVVDGVRRQFDVPPPKGGLQCSIELEKNVFAVGEPIGLSVRIRNVSGKPLTALAPSANAADLLAVKDAAGAAVACAAPAAGGAAEEREIKPWEEIRRAFRLDESHKLAQAGRWTVMARYRFGEQADAVAESHEAAVLVVPRDFLSLRIDRTGKPVAAERGAQIMADVTLAKSADAPALSDVELVFRAMPKGGGADSWLQGTPVGDENAARKEQKHIPPALQPGKGSAAFRYDLGLATWARTFGPPLAPGTTLWDFVQMSDTWQVQAVCSGRADGDRFQIVSDPMPVKILRDQPKGKTRR